MRTLGLLLTAALLLSPVAAQAQDGRAAVDAVAKALGATDLKSLEIQGGGTVFWAGQSHAPGLAIDQVLPLHGRMVPLAELHKAAGHSH